MIRILPKALLILTMFTLLTNQINAYCARCAKIEEERAKEQAAHPQPAGYYDDQVSLRLNKETSAPIKGDQTPSGDEKKTLKTSPYQQSSPSTKTNTQDPLENRVLSTSPNSKDHNLAVSYLAQNQNSRQNQTSKSSANDLNLPKEDFFEEEEVIQKESELLKTGKTSGEDSTKGYFPGSHSSAPSPSYSTIFTILKTRFLLETLDGAFTLFLPTDEALRALPPGTFEELIKPENQEKLAALISNHVIGKKILRKDFESHQNQEIKAISGRNLTVNYKNGKLSVDGAQIIRIEPAGYDGVIYIIDKVLIPNPS